MRTVNFVALVLIIVGAINWGMMGMFDENIVTRIIPGQVAALRQAIYILIGVAGLYGISFFQKL